MDYTFPASDPLGTDLRLTPDGDLSTDISGSLSLVTLADNVAQAVRIYLTTIPSEYRFGNGVGTAIGEYVDKPLTPLMINAVKSIVFQTLSNDPRILQIRETMIDTSTPNTMLITVIALVEAAGIVQIPVPIN